jgi:hypothetical protein
VNPSEPTAVLTAALLAAVPLLPLLVAGRVGGSSPPRMSPGRFFLAYAIVFAGLLTIAKWLGTPLALMALGLLLGALGTGVALPLLYRWLFGSRWLEQHPQAPLRDAARWQLPLLATSVACIATAIGLAYLP